MLTIETLDAHVPIKQQVNEIAAPVVLINFFTVDLKDKDALLKAWEQDANWWKKQPGYISTQLHRGIGGRNVFLNYAVWESVAHFRAAFSHPDFSNALSTYPSSAVARPHLFSKVEVPNICTK